MRIRTEGFGTYNFGPLIAIGLALLGAGIAGLVMLIVALVRGSNGRPSPGLLIGGIVLMAPVVLIFLL